MNEGIFNVMTPFEDVAALGTGYMQRADGERLWVPLPQPATEGDEIRFVIHLLDGTPAFAGTGHCIQVADQGEHVDAQVRFEALLDTLVFDERSRPVYDYIVAVRAAALQLDFEEQADLGGDGQAGYHDNPSTETQYEYATAENAYPGAEGAGAVEGSPTSLAESDLSAEEAAEQDVDAMMANLTVPPDEGTDPGIQPALTLHEGFANQAFQGQDVAEHPATRGETTVETAGPGDHSGVHMASEYWDAGADLGTVQRSSGRPLELIDTVQQVTRAAGPLEPVEPDAGDLALPVDPDAGPSPSGRPADHAVETVMTPSILPITTGVLTRPGIALHFQPVRARGPARSAATGLFEYPPGVLPRPERPPRPRARVHASDGNAALDMDVQLAQGPERAAPDVQVYVPETEGTPAASPLEGPARDLERE